MVRGLVAKERLLEWSIDDGWEPLCNFLGKSIPQQDFPHANAISGGWKAREEMCNKRWVEGAFLTMFSLLGVLGIALWCLLRYT